MKRFGVFLILLPIIFLSAELFAEKDVLTVYDVQYTTNAGSENTYPSPYAEQVVTVRGVVTYAAEGDNPNFYISDSEGGPWTGLYVYDNTVSPNVGDDIELTGKVFEFFGLTELKDITSSTVHNTGMSLPEAISVSTGTLTSDSKSNAAAEPYEGCLVYVSDVTVTEAPGEFGEWYVNDGSGICQVDNPYYMPDPEPQVNDTFFKIQGFLDYSYNEYGILPRHSGDVLVEGDSTPPEIVNAESQNSVSVLIEFSEEVSEVTAENTSNYSIDNGLTVSNAELQENGYEVLLTTSEQTSEMNYTITVNNIEDLSGNTIAEDSEISFTGYQAGEALTVYDIQYTAVPGSENTYPSPYAEQVVTVRGIVTYVAEGDNPNFYISDSDGGPWTGLYVYDNTVSPNVGDDIELTGKVFEFFGLTELKDITSSTVHNTGMSLPEAISVSTGTLTSDSKSNAAAEPYEGCLVYVSDVTVTEAPGDFGEWYINDGSGICQVDNPYYMPDPEPQIDDTYSLIRGFVDYSYGEYGVLPRNESDVQTGGDDTTPPTIENASAQSSTTVKISFSESVEETTAETLTNYSIDNGLTVSAAELQTNGTDIILTTSEQTSGQNYTITVNNIEDIAGNTISADSEISFTGYEQQSYTDISDIIGNYSSYEGQQVTVWGVVTIGINVIQTGRTSVYIQDDSGRGIQVFDYDEIDGFERGNKVEVTGTVGKYNDNFQLTDPTVTVLGTGFEDPSPYIVNITEDVSDLSLSGTLLEVTGELVEIYAAGGGANLNITDGTTQITVRVWDTAGIDYSYLQSGDQITARGVGSVYNGNVQIVPGYDDQIEGGVLPDFALSGVLSTSETSLMLTFNQDLNSSAAEELSHYSIDGLTISNAAVQDGKKVVLTTSQQTEGTEYTLNITGIENTEGATIDTSVTFLGYSGDYIPIAQIIDNFDSYNGSTVTVQGIVTIGINVVQTGRTKAYIMDDSRRGIQVFDYDEMDGFERGNKIEVTGVVGAYNGEFQLTEPEVTVLGTGFPQPEPVEITVDDIEETDLNGTLLKIEGILGDIYVAGGGANLNIEDNGEQVTVRVWESTGINYDDFNVGDRITAIGVGSLYNNKLQIVPGYQDHISIFQYGTGDVEFSNINWGLAQSGDLGITVTAADVILKGVRIKIPEEWQWTGEADDVQTNPAGTVTVLNGKDIKITGVEIAAGSSIDVNIANLQAPVTFSLGGWEVYTSEDGYNFNLLEEIPYMSVGVDNPLEVEARVFDPDMGHKMNIAIKHVNKVVNDIPVHVVLRIYNLRGEHVTTILDEDIPASEEVYARYLTWDGKNELREKAAVGTYILHFRAVDGEGNVTEETAPVVIGKKFE